MKIFCYVLILFITIGVTLSRILLERVGLESDYLFVALGAIVVIGLLVYRGLLLVILVLIMSIAVNLPQDFLY